MPFHKSCYTARSSGYKYRTLSTNTGERRKLQRPSIQQEVSTIDQKVHNLHDNISVLIEKEFEETESARETINEKFSKIDAKINFMIELQDNVLCLRETLTAAENSLADLCKRVSRIEVMSELNCVKNRRSGHRAERPLKPVQILTEEEVEQELKSEIIATPMVAL